MMYLGFDIGKRAHDAALLDADGTVRRQLRFAPTRPGLQRLAAWRADVDPVDVTVGLEAHVEQSGPWQGRVRMSERGNRYVRRAIMLAAQTAARTDPQCRAIYEAQRAKGKHHTVAVSHVVHQLLHIAYSVLLHSRPYVLPARFTTASTTALVEAGT